MIELLKYILTSIVSDPSAVVITSEDNNGEVTLNVQVPQADRGIVIGKEGRNIKAIRDIVSIIARRENKKVYIKILD